ncbi:dTMP kinase [Candidatus Dojkabacteria bacterium]|nr:dTMP kinase [Candidatus Dojkabacteria bacterium]
MSKGKYIIFEGIVGTGKSTQSKQIYSYLEDKYPNKKFIWTFEPGGSEIADEIRRVVQATEYEEKMDPICEAYLYASSRAQTIRKIIKPNLEKGNIVIADRSFLTSIAYQGFARELGPELILKINESALDDCFPDLVLFLDLDIKPALQRTFDFDGDKFEKESVDFFKKALKGYKYASQLSKLKNKWVTINARGNIDEVYQRIIKVLNKRLEF